MVRMPKYLALKIDVDTWRGTREGVPRLVEMLKRHGANATFFFTLGPDHMGRAIKRVFRPGYLGKVSRMSVVEHYGIKTLLYGTLLPAPDIGKSCAAIMRNVRDEGFEVGIHCYDHIRWQDHVVDKDNAWTDAEFKRAVDRYSEIFAEAPKAHAAAGWQMNREAFRLLQNQGFNYSSDTRGTQPFIPVWQGEITNCPQLPTTLPTLDELINRENLTLENLPDHMLALTAAEPEKSQVLTLHAELEGGKWMPLFERMLEGWKAQGFELVSIAQYRAGLDPAKLPLYSVEMREVDGRIGKLAVQAAPYP